MLKNLNDLYDYLECKDTYGYSSYSDREEQARQDMLEFEKIQRGVDYGEED